MSEVILAAKVEFFDETLQILHVSDAPAYIDNEMWEPRIDRDVRWSESTRHPYQAQNAGVSVGDLVLVNTDGGLDDFVEADLIGYTTELRRGSPESSWADMELVFVARNAGVRLDGRSQVIIELANVLGELSGPVFTDRFSGTGNDALDGQDKPFVIGKIRQAPVEIFNPALLEYFSADNTTATNAVQEGATPTTNFTASGSIITLLASPTLQITADFENNASLTYADAVPYILTTAGISTVDHLDSDAINAHDADFGSPEIGWLLSGDESVDQVLTKLAGSLGGYYWQGLDGRVRSKRLTIPEQPSGEFLTLDDSRVNIETVDAVDDLAPNLTTRAEGLRNWQPIDPDRQAGITATWTETDRALAAANWRITRTWNSTPTEATQFARRWPQAEANTPYASALTTAPEVQLLANQVLLWNQRPRFYELEAEVQFGELDLVAVGSIVRVRLDYPGLRGGAWLLVLGREGSGLPGVVRLSLWGYPSPAFLDRTLTTEAGAALLTEAGDELRTEDLL